MNSSDDTLNHEDMQAGHADAERDDEAVLDQYLDSVPLDPQQETADASVEDYTDQQVEHTVADAQEQEAPDSDTSMAAAEDAAQQAADESAEDAPGDQDLEETVVAADGDVETSVESVIEAILFASDEPVTVTKLSAIVEGGVKQVRDAVKALNDRYVSSHSAFRIETIAGGYQMLTLPHYNHWLRKLIKVRSDNKLTAAALETLAIVAYKQPVIRADIEAIRGVASGEMLRGLMVKGLVKMVGRAELVGRPMQYGTTRKFLEIFGLNSLKDLPNVEELKQPSNES